MSVFRSLLFAPGNHARRVEKALTLDADAVVLDLEDAVAVAEKPAARGKVVAAFQAPRRAPGYVRVNAFDTPFCFDDLHAVVTAGIDGIVLPKVESPAQLVAVDWVISSLERARGLAAGGIDLMPIIETGRGVAALREIARSGPRVRRLSFGAGDYTLDMGMRWTFGERELDHARAAIVLESRAAGLDPPIDTVFIHLGEAGRAPALHRARPRSRIPGQALHPSRAGGSGQRGIHPDRRGDCTVRTLRRRVRAGRGERRRLHPGGRVLHRLPHRGEGAAHAPDRESDIEPPSRTDPAVTMKRTFDSMKLEFRDSKCLLITHKARINGFFQPVIPASAGMTGFRRACVRVSIEPGAQAELCA